MKSFTQQEIVFQSSSSQDLLTINEEILSMNNSESKSRLLFETKEPNFRESM
jgi:hypothetical protein